MNKKLNPFNITKAVDLSDQEINDYYVEIGSSGFQSVIKPTSAMPMIVLGGKGSGKTHLMRYFSFHLQKIRHDSLIEGISLDGYLGIYLRCSGLNSNRFSGKGIEESDWRQIFSYYIELWLSELLLDTVLQLIEHDASYKDFDREITQESVKLLDKDAPKINSIEELKQFIIQLRKDVDFAVNNVSFTGKREGFLIYASPGSLLFGLPKIVCKKINKLKKITILYLIDEFENLTNEQQKYFNTLYREKELPTTFKIGARLYGFRTKSTFSADEENKEGSEFEIFHIDDFFRKENSKYEEFVKSLCVKRLQQHGYLQSNVTKQFELFKEKEFLQKLSSKYSESEAPYFLKVRRLLEKYKFDKPDEIINLLKVPSEPLLERTNLFLFYRIWSEGKVPLIAAAKKINKETIAYKKDHKHKGPHATVLDKFKDDILSQLALDCGERVHYSGFNTFVDMSSGIPRNLLKILKQIFQRSEFASEKPFDGGLISLDSQTTGVKEAADWFYEDAKMPGKIGVEVRSAISNLSQFLREIRYSNLPPESSLCSFTFNSSSIEEQSLEKIELAVKSSYLIKVGERRDKNEKRLDPIYQINGILAPKWDLPIYKRGELTLSKKEVQAIFGTNKEQFDQVLKERIERYNAPFNIDSSTPLFK